MRVAGTATSRRPSPLRSATTTWPQTQNGGITTPPPPPPPQAEPSSRAAAPTANEIPFPRKPANHRTIHLPRELPVRSRSVGLLRRGVSLWEPTRQTGGTAVNVRLQEAPCPAFKVNPSPPCSPPPVP